MSDAALRTSAPEATAGRSALQRLSRRPLLPVAGALLLAALGAFLILSPKSSVTTDAAYLAADSSAVAPKVRGLVAEVMVGHNQPVRRGDPLVRIDPEEFDARAAAAAADLLSAKAQVRSANAALSSLLAEERLAASNVAAAKAAIASAGAQRERAETDRRRYETLAASGAVARRDADAVRAAAVTARSEEDKDRALFDVSRSQADVTAAKRETLQAALEGARAAEDRAAAALAIARQDQRHALVRSPIDGVAGDRQVEPGDYVQPGTRLMSVVPLQALYVTADFKETQVGRMRVGQRAVVRVDALPGRRLMGTVDSFAPGSGSQFSLLPFEPGTGNFTKVVQRVPVRIRLDPGQRGLETLRPGLSSVVTVRLTSGS